MSRGVVAPEPASPGLTSVGSAATGVEEGRRRSKGSGARASEASANSGDPLRLCVYATVALLGWLLGPWAVFGFAALGFAGYRRARRAGLTRSRCVLRDTRLVLGYLAVLGLAAAVGAGLQLAALLR
jgi:hypothetical protein